MYYAIINTNHTNNQDAAADIRIIDLCESSQQLAENAMAFYATQNYPGLVFGTAGKVDADITDSDQLLDLDNNLAVCWERGDERIDIDNSEIRISLLNSEKLDDETEAVVQAFAEQVGASDEHALHVSAHTIADIYRNEELTGVMDAKIIPVRGGFLLYSTGKGEFNEVHLLETQCETSIREFWNNLDVDLLSPDRLLERTEALKQIAEQF